MSEFTKQRVTMQYTEVVYMKDGVEVGRDELYDAHMYDSENPVPMTEREVEGWK